MNRSVESSGFTLIEIMVTVALVGVLASISGTSYLKYVEKARVARCISEMQSIALVLDSFEADEGSLPEDMIGVADHMRDPWGKPYQYLKISGKLPKGLASTNTNSLPHVSAKGGGGNDKGSSGGSIMGSVRKDRFLAPINTDYDLYSAGPDGESKSSLQTKVSKDDVVRASNGSYFGPAKNF